MSRFTIEPLALAGLTRICRHPIGDQRGRLTRMFCAEALREAGWVDPVAQINHSVTLEAGTVRGLHFQYPPSAEAKLVSCIAGEVWDVAVDLRRGSPTFLRWHAELLSAHNNTALLIPKGFAHGFQTLTGDCQLLYLHSAAYDPAREGGIRPMDPAIAIDWPRPVTEMSARDAGHQPITDEFLGIDA